MIKGSLFTSWVTWSCLTLHNIYHPLADEVLSRPFLLSGNFIAFSLAIERCINFKNQRTSTSANLQLRGVCFDVFRSIYKKSRLISKTINFWTNVNGFISIQRCILHLISSFYQIRVSKKSAYQRSRDHFGLAVESTIFYLAQIFLEVWTRGIIPHRSGSKHV